MSDRIVDLRETVLAMQQAPIYRREPLASKSFGLLLEILRDYDERLTALEGSVCTTTPSSPT